MLVLIFMNLGNYYMANVALFLPIDILFVMENSGILDREIEIYSELNKIWC